jgi:DNA (cytosine-5)-methyltransferase 1
MGGDRSSLILEAIRLVRECRPRVFIWENVKGAFSSNSGEDFAAIIQEFADIGGYRLEWQLLNTSWFLPQNRERIYLVGYSTTPKRGWRGVFPIRESGEQTNLRGINLIATSENDVQSRRVYGSDGIARTLTSGDYKSPMRVEVKQIGTRLDSGGKQPYQQDRIYDSIGHAPALNAGKSDLIVAMRGRYNEDGSTSQRLELNTSGKSNTLTVVQKDNMVIQPMIGIGIYGNNKENQYQKKITRALALKASNQTNPRSGGTTLIGIQPNYDSKALNETIENSNLIEGEPQALDLYNRLARDESPTLTEPHHNSLRMFDGYRIRRLTPIECERLQGFPDDHTSFGNYDGEVKPVSNTQRYKQCGNAVTVNVVEAVAKKCIPLFK